MIKEAVAQGSTVEEAFARACAELGVDTAEATCEVLELPTKKTFGIFGGKPAKVKATVEVPDPVEKKPQPKRETVKPEPVKSEPVKAAPAPVQEKPKKEEKPVQEEKAVETAEAPAEPAKTAPKEGVDPAGEAAAYLKRVLAEMGVENVEIDVTREENSASLSLTGGDISFIIGHRGETLDALQYLASLVANHVGEAYYRVTLDVGNYREKRKTTLEALGRRMAIRAVKSGRNSSLEPMNPYERRIIHTAVQAIEGATSWSEGEGQGRHVVIGPEGGERRQRRDDRGRGGYNRSRNGGSRPRNGNRGGSKPAQSNAASQPRSDDPSAPIYGKIEVKK